MLSSKSASQAFQGRKCFRRLSHEIALVVHTEYTMGASMYVYRSTCHLLHQTHIRTYVSVQGTFNGIPPTGCHGYEHMLITCSLEHWSLQRASSSLPGVGCQGKPSSLRQSSPSHTQQTCLAFLVCTVCHHRCEGLGGWQEEWRWMGGEEVERGEI